MRSTHQQRNAINPQSSVWVGASAGTGKTKVLTDRLLTLLLNNTPPERILCLTFTKAAAAEMSERTAKILSTWVTDSEDALRKKITDLLDKEPHHHELTKARQLFARVIGAPGGMKVLTIHGFCQSVLKRFPLEAGLTPHFDLLTEEKKAQLLSNAQNVILSGLGGNVKSELSSALDFIIQQGHETTFPDLIKAVITDRAKIQHLIRSHNGVHNATAAIQCLLGLQPSDTKLSIQGDISDDSNINTKELRAVAQTLAIGTKTEVKRSKAILSWLNSPLDRRLQHYEEYALVFLINNKTDVRKTLANKGTIQALPNAELILQDEGHRLLRGEEKQRAVVISEASSALLHIGSAFLQEYKNSKDKISHLDYDDLISLTKDLFETPGIASWVLFKLDGGLDHLLIDEAQDTNANQWAIIQALTEEFFSTQEDNKNLRTVFAVGDRKQSIYSFQGADPRGFDSMKGFFSNRIQAAKREWAEVKLDRSFRSTQTILRAVDAVFRSEPAKTGVVLQGDTLNHQPTRIGQAGHVEVWPPLPTKKSEEKQIWKMPIEDEIGSNPETRLAHTIAQRIYNMCKNKECLESQGRAIMPGDILVLVRKRSAFIDHLVRSLKDLNIGVAGTDRMVLVEQMAVMDLIALGRFLLLPEDDLTLATILKSPLLGLSEDHIFELSHNRNKSSLWSKLASSGKNNKIFKVTHNYLSQLLVKSGALSPFELYSHILVKNKGRQKLLSRLGMEAEDPIDEFLTQALQYEKQNTPSLEGFLHWIERGQLQIKRDLEQADPNNVRIITVHGAKGIEAPIVFLPDTMSKPKNDGQIFWASDRNKKPLMLWAPNVTHHEQVIKELKSESGAAADQEYRRLLYVAMTRAKDQLFICGWERKVRAPDDCWYNLIAEALKPLAKKVESTFLKAAGFENCQILTIHNNQSAKVSESHHPNLSEIEQRPLPDFFKTKVNTPYVSPIIINPSQNTFSNHEVSSPLAERKLQNTMIGNITHSLLQYLPKIPVNQRLQSAKIFLQNTKWELTQTEITEVIGQVNKLLSDPELEYLFSAQSKAEVPIVGKINDRIISGKIDRLVVTDELITIVDYKTNKAVPHQVQNVNRGYLFQLAAYYLCIADAYPKTEIKCLLLWTRGPVPMHIPNNVLENIWKST